jgi:2,4-dienoyl-CoA reductase-like NADH-dependent reductase (Old Yellow Enzyme family)
MNCRDWAEGGLEPDDAIQAAVLMQKAGADAIEISSGLPRFSKFTAVRPGIDTAAKEAYHQEEAKAFKQRLKVPLILVGGIRSFAVAERLVSEGVCDFISMSRPFIREPGLVNRWKSGDRQPAACTSDNLCFGPIRKGDGFYCVTADKEKSTSMDRPKT